MMRALPCRPRIVLPTERRHSELGTTGRRQKKREEEERLQKLKDEKMRELQQLVIRRHQVNERALGVGDLEFCAVS